MNSLFKTVTCSQSKVVNIAQFDDLQIESQSIHITDLNLNMFIGINEKEKQEKQNVIVNAEIFLEPSSDWQNENINDLVSYADIVDLIENIVSSGHIDLVETFAHKIIEGSFKLSTKVISMAVKIDKTDIMSQTQSVGCCIKKVKTSK